MLGDSDESCGTLRLQLREPRLIRRPLASLQGVANTPRFSADGPLGGETYQVPFAGDTPVSLTPGFRGSFNALLWRGKQCNARAC